jgi:hypothetical protein
MCDNKPVRGADRSTHALNVARTHGYCYTHTVFFGVLLYIAFPQSIGIACFIIVYNFTSAFTSTYIHTFISPVTIVGR